MNATFIRVRERCPKSNNKNIGPVSCFPITITPAMLDSVELFHHLAKCSRGLIYNILLCPWYNFRSAVTSGVAHKRPRNEVETGGCTLIRHGLNIEREHVHKSLSGL